MNSNKFKILITIILLLTVNAFAGLPSFFPISGSKVTSLNGIYAAGSGGIASLTTNPAGLTRLTGRGIELSVFGRLGQYDYVNEENKLYRSYRDDDIGVNLGAYWNLTDNFTVAVDYNNAYQYRTDWPYAKFIQGDSSTSILAFDHFNDYTITSINPSAAVNFGSLSIGVSVNIMNIKHSLGFYQGYENWEATLASIAAYQVITEEDAWAFGGTVGMQAKVTPALTVGAFIKSTISASLEGTSESRLFADIDSTDSKTSVSSDFELPWVFGAGVLYQVNENLKLNVDVVYNLWGSTQETKNYNYGNSIWNDRFSTVDSLSGYTGSSFTLKFNNTFDLGLGLEYDTQSDVVLRFGYRFSQSRNSEATYSLLYPTVDQHWFSFGIGFWFEELFVDMAVAYGLTLEKTVSKSENYFHPGNYSGDAYIPSINIKYQF